MEPTTLISAALFSAVPAELGNEAVADIYEELKIAISMYFGDDGELTKALADYEDKPESEVRGLILRETIAETRFDDCPEILGAAQALLEQIQSGGR